MSKEISPAMEFLSLLWKHVQSGTDHSWLKLNHAMHAGLFLAVRAGMQFDEDDFLLMSSRFRLGYWRGDLEIFYREAVLYRHPTAWQAFEKQAARKPFIVKGASIYVHTGNGPCGQGLSRLIVGAEFKWNGERVQVNSFNDEKGHVNACSFAPVGKSECCPKCHHVIRRPEKKILHRYKITHADIKATNAEAKKTKKAAQMSEQVGA